MARRKDALTPAPTPDPTKGPVSVHVSTPTLAGGPTRAIRYTAAEAAAQERFVEALVVYAHTDHEIQRLSALPVGPDNPTGLGQRLTLGRIKKLRQRVLDRWREERVASSSDVREAAIRRIQRSLRQLINAGVSRNASAIAQLEKLLAQMQGTLAPIEVNVHAELKQTSVTVMMEMDQSEVDEMLAEMRAAKERARLYEATVDAVTPANDESKERSA